MRSARRGYATAVPGVRLCRHDDVVYAFWIGDDRSCLMSYDDDVVYVWLSLAVPSKTARRPDHSGSIGIDSESVHVPLGWSDLAISGGHSWASDKEAWP